MLSPPFSEERARGFYREETKFVPSVLYVHRAIDPPAEDVSLSNQVRDHIKVHTSSPSYPFIFPLVLARDPTRRSLFLRVCESDVSEYIGLIIVIIIFYDVFVDV